MLEMDILPHITPHKVRSGIPQPRFTANRASQVRHVAAFSHVRFIAAEHSERYLVDPPGPGVMPPNLSEEELKAYIRNSYKTFGQVSEQESMKKSML